MRRILAFALLAAVLAATVPVSILTAGKASAGGGFNVDASSAAHRGR